MANKRISDLDNLGATPAAGDIIPITDVSDTVTSGNPNGTTKGVTFGDLTNHLATQVSLGNHESLTSLVHGISAFGATLVDDADASTARTTLGLGTAATTASTDYATAAQGSLADSATQPGDNISTLTNDSGFIDSSGAPVQSVAGRTGAVTLSDTDISGLGTAATQDVGTADGNVVQLDATGLPAVDGSQLTNVSGTDSTKLAIANDLSDLNDAATARTNLGVDASGTDNSTDVTLAAVTNNYLTIAGQEITAGIVPVSLGGTGSGDLATARANLGLGTAATTASTDYATSAQGTLADSAVQPAGIANMVETTDSIDVLADVDTSTVSPAPNDLLKWDGTNFVPGTVTVDVDTPLNTALRGTTNPHIGAYPNQSFKVIDNPQKSVMVVADEDGNLEFVVNSDNANIFLRKPSSVAAASFGFSVSEDTSEPDIEVASGGENYSVISGDSDSKGANGLPIRQGFNLPDIGANPAPILISGGSIA